MSRKSIVLALVLCGIAAASGAQLTPPDVADYEVLLVPLAPEGVEGAEGSIWLYEFGALNTGGTTLIGYPRPLDADRPAPDVFPAATLCLFPICDLVTRFRPGVVVQSVLSGVDELGQSGLLLYVRREIASSVRFQTRIRDVSRGFYTAGAELQPVRESAFLVEPVHLINVPSEPRFRVTLRVYGMRPAEGNVARVRMFDQATGELLHDAAYALAQPLVQSDETYPGFELHPDYVQVTDLPLPSPGAYRVRFEVASLVDGAPIWAFASVTNNETQEFTVVTPSRGR